jgi:hypothetical protein
MVLFIDCKKTYGSKNFGDLLFFSFNGKGLKLDEVDLVRSIFVRYSMDTLEKRKEFKAKWANIINITQDDLKNIFIKYHSIHRLPLKSSQR